MRMPRDVDRLRERACVAVRRQHDDEVAAWLERQRPARERLRELFVVRAAVLREGVDELPARVPHLDQPELVDVPRDRRLHYLMALVPECVRKLGLGRDGLLADEPLDRGVALVAVHALKTSVRMASARSTSSPVTTSGGARRRTFGPDVSATSPASSAASTKGCAGVSSSAPTRRPIPRASTTCGRCASPRRSVSPFAPTEVRRPSSITLYTATAAAHATGFPPNVEPWSPGTNPPAASSETSSAPIGSPLARLLARATRSSFTSSCANAKKEPVRPMPVWTSSSARTASRSLAAARNSRLSGMTPPSPSTGSRSTRPTSSPMAARSPSMSFGCTKRTLPRSGSKAARFVGWPVTDNEPVVRPWKLCSSAITPGFPVALRAYFSAASFVSVPELQKNACAPPKRSERVAASSRTGSVP